MADKSIELNQIISKDTERLLKQKLKALGVSDKCLQTGDIE